MGKVLMVFISLVAVPFISLAQMKHSPYAGQERREIKALSQEDMEGYLRGRGMGFGPGPGLARGMGRGQGRGMGRGPGWCRGPGRGRGMGMGAGLGCCEGC